MGAIKLGPARVPSRESPEIAVQTLLAGGYTACEIDFEGGFWMDYPWAERFGELSRDAGIVLSVHAPLAGFLGQVERDKKHRMAIGMLDHSAGVAVAAGAELVLIHPRLLLGRAREDALAPGVAQLGEVRERRRGEGRRGRPRRGRRAARRAARAARGEGPRRRLRRRGDGPRAGARDGGGRLLDRGAAPVGPAGDRLRPPPRRHRRRLPRDEGIPRRAEGR